MADVSQEFKLLELKFFHGFMASRALNGPTLLKTQNLLPTDAV